MNKLSLIWKTPSLRNKILVVIGLLLLTRLITQIPVPGIDISQLQGFFNNPANKLFGFINILSGGGLARVSLAMLGVGPYITASIVMQLLTIIVPSLEDLQKEGGEAGREKINRYTRYLAIPLALLQAFGTIRYIQISSNNAVFGTFTPFQWFLTLLSVTAGTMLLVWLGEVISEYGIGNGVSLIIFAGIVASIPSAVIPYLPKSLTGVDSVYVASNLNTYLIILVLAIAVIAAIVLMTEAQRNIPISYARQNRGGRLVGGVSTYLPIRLNPSGVIPIIFAVSVVLFPAMIAQFFLNSRHHIVSEIAKKTQEIFNQQSWEYAVAYFILVLVFTFFYSTIVFKPNEVAENVQKNGGFIPGLRPGAQTEHYLEKVLYRIVFPGAIFLGVIALLPFILQQIFSGSGFNITFGGTSLLIVVSVVIETIKQIEGQLAMHDYENI